MPEDDERQKKILEYQKEMKTLAVKFLVHFWSVCKKTFIVSTKIYLVLGVLGYLTAPIPRLQYYVRSLGYLWCVVLHSSVGMIVSLAGPLGLQGYVGWSAGLAHSLFTPFVNGVRYKLSGTEHLKNLSKGPHVIALNHQTAADLQSLACIYPANTTIVVKEDLLRVPFVGHLLRGIQAIGIARSDRNSAMQALRDVSKRMRKEHLSTIIFPEGTRRNAEDLELQSFKLGAFLMAIPEQIPILPIVVQNVSRGMNHARRRWPGGTFNMQVLPPISTAGYEMSNEGAAKLSTHVRNIMQDTYRKLGH